jgi:ABC-type nitrate/sulfonate/bicarbonate transport system permease component
MAAVMPEVTVRGGLLGASTRARTGDVASRVALIALTLTVWELGAPMLGAQAVPTVGPTFAAARDLVVAEPFWSAVFSTLQSWALGLAIAAAIAIPLGLALGSSETLVRLTRGVVEFLRTVPSIMLVPLVVLMYGSTIKMKVVLIVLAAVWPLLLQAIYGIREVDRVARETTTTFHVTRRLRITHLFLPSAAPFIATGLRVAATIGLLISVGAEIITSAPGLGYEISVAQSNGNAARSFVYIAVAGLLGVAINKAFAYGETRVLFWHASQRLRSER